MAPRPIKELIEWVDTIGYNPTVWLGGDWHVPLHLLSKLLAKELAERRKAENLDETADVKVGFDTILQLAEDCLGIPVLVTQRDLIVRYPNVNLALLTLLVCTKSAIEHIDCKQIRERRAPERLVFEAKNGSEASLPRCPACNDHVFIIERVIFESAVFHRQCFKCTECSRLLSRGAFKKTKNGFECISHAVRRILDAHESNSGSGSGTYDRYGGRSPRPNVAPPPRPKPKLPPKPAYLSRKEDIYETLDDFQKEQSSVSATASTAATYDSLEEERKENDSPKQPEQSPSPSIVEESSGDNSSCDSGVVLRMAKMFSEQKNEKSEAARSPPRVAVRISQPAVTTPVAPPRPKRTSMLVAGGSKTLPRSSSPNPSISSNTSTLSRTGTGGWSSPSVTEKRPKHRLELDDYPNYLCPFGEDEEEEAPAESTYPSSKNPFADSDDESSKPPVPAPRAQPPPLPVLPGTSDRPKAAPPPPPNGAPAGSQTPPPKPPRGQIGDGRMHTLIISRKKVRAPLPPIPMMRKINFTDRGETLEINVVTSRLSSIDDQMTRVEVEGRAIEKEMLFQIATNPSSWMKSGKTDDWIEILTKKLDLMREQLSLLGLWRESYLNDVHAETEYYIRCLLEKNQQDKSEWELEREATLTALLIDIIDEKCKLDEYMADLETDGNPRRSEKEAQKKSKLRKRVGLLKKKLKHKKEKSPKAADS